MAVIAIGGFDPVKADVKALLNFLKPIINGKFRIVKMPNMQDHKVCIVKLSEDLDPNVVIRNIHFAYKPPFMNIFAYIPGKTKKTFSKKYVAYRTINQFIIKTFYELHKELQFKYNKLFMINMSDGHKIMDAMNKIIVERLKYVMASNKDYACIEWKLGQLYRQSYPHNTDLALLQSAYDQVQDNVGKPRSILVEKDIIHMLKDPNPKTYPFNKVMKTAMRFTREITSKVDTYIQSLPTEADNANLTHEEILQKNIRRELKNLAPYLNLMVQQIVNKQWTLNNDEMCKIRVFGEPDIPEKNILEHLFRKFDIKNFNMCPFMYNVSYFSVHESVLPELLQMDGITIAGAKLTIRTASTHVHISSMDKRDSLFNFARALTSI